jgi:hypothetical protein
MHRFNYDHQSFDIRIYSPLILFIYLIYIFIPDINIYVLQYIEKLLSTLTIEIKDIGNME